MNLAGTWMWLVQPEVTGLGTATSTGPTVHPGTEGSLPRLSGGQAQDARWQAQYELPQAVPKLQVHAREPVRGQEDIFPVLLIFLPTPAWHSQSPELFTQPPRTGALRRPRGGWGICCSRLGGLFSLLVLVPLVRFLLPTRLLEALYPLESPCLPEPSPSAGREPSKLPDHALPTPPLRHLLCPTLHSWF